MAYSSSTTTECVLTCGYSQKDAPNEVDDLRRQIQALQAAVTELERKVDERGKLLRVSEEIRAQLTKDNHDLKEINAQLRYLSTPAPFQEQYLFKVRGTPPSAKKKRAVVAIQSSSVVRISGRVAKRSSHDLEMSENTSKQKILKTGGEPSSSGSHSSTTVGGARTRPSSSNTRTQTSRPSRSGTAPGAILRSQQVKVEDLAPEPGMIASSSSTAARDRPKRLYFSSDELTGQLSHPGRKLLPVAVNPRDSSQAHQPWFDDPTVPLLTRVTDDAHGDFTGCLSSGLIDDVLDMQFGQPSASAKCNAKLVIILKQLIAEQGVHMSSFRWASLGRILFENRLRWVGWPSEMHHDPKPHDRPAGIPGSLRAGEMHLLKRVLAKRFPPYVNSGLRLVKWSQAERQEDFPALFITTEGSHHNLRKTIEEFAAQDPTLMVSRRKTVTDPPQAFHVPPRPLVIRLARASESEVQSEDDSENPSFVRTDEALPDPCQSLIPPTVLHVVPLKAHAYPPLPLLRSCSQSAELAPNVKAADDASWTDDETFVKMILGAKFEEESGM